MLASRFILAFIATVLLSAPASAATIPLRAWLNGAQVPLAVGGTGVGTASFDTVTITGTNFGCTGCFGAVNAVRFAGPGGSGANGVAAQFTINSPTQITATVPAGTLSGTIWIQALGATATSGQSFTVN